MAQQSMFLAMALLSGCAITPPPIEPEPQDPVPADMTGCEQAGERLAELGCQEAATPEGTPFAVVCADAAADGRDYHPECIATIQDCSEAESAYRGELCR